MFAPSPKPRLRARSQRSLKSSSSGRSRSQRAPLLALPRSRGSAELAASRHRAGMIAADGCPQGPDSRLVSSPCPPHVEASWPNGQYSQARAFSSPAAPVHRQPPRRPPDRGWTRSRLTVVDNLFLGREENLADARARFAGVASVERGCDDRRDGADPRRGSRVDVVFNLAVVPLPASLDRPALEHRAHVALVDRSCELLREERYATLIHFSSSEAYGSAAYVPMDEDHPSAPSTPYAASKSPATNRARRTATPSASMRPSCGRSTTSGRARTRARYAGHHPDRRQRAAQATADRDLRRRRADARLRLRARHRRGRRPHLRRRPRRAAASSTSRAAREVDRSTSCAAAARRARHPTSPVVHVDAATRRRAPPLRRHRPGPQAHRLRAAHDRCTTAWPRRSTGTSPAESAR